MYLPMGMVRIGQASTMAEGRGAMLMAGVSIPLWRERLRAGVGEARAMEDMARADWQAMQRMIEGEAAAARNQVEAARTRFLAFRDEVVPRAQSAVTPALADYAAGQGSLTAVIEAAQALWSAQGELVMAETGLGLAWARLDRAAGTWEQEAPVQRMAPPVPPTAPTTQSPPLPDNNDEEDVGEEQP
jgi:outer membrane protein TolC